MGSHEELELMPLQLSSLQTPKQVHGTSKGVEAWYDYYAGYSPLFVADVLRRFEIPDGESILDPWNGVGTTTQVVREHGYHAIGFDLNPVAVIVAKARQLQCGVMPSIAILCSEIVATAKDAFNDWRAASEPLGTWFMPAAASGLRRIEASIQHLLISHNTYGKISRLASLETVSDLCAFFYTALFRVVRRLLTDFRASNPAWIKRKVDENKRVALPFRVICSLFQESVAQMTPALKNRKTELKTNCLLDLGLSTRLLLPDDSVAAVITSPPYCTRIDYAITTSPELAILGMDLSSDLKQLRDSMIGTSTIANTPQMADARWGPTCEILLDKISSHPSRAARTYYLKTYLQYFNGLHLSVAEISRVLKSGGKAAIVVQDSYFKEVYVDLASVVIEMCSQLNLTSLGKVDFPARRTMGCMHKHVRKYREFTSATESVVVLSKN